MKKLLGVMILATLPVACGTTTNPNGPELPSTGAPVDTASVSASDRGRNSPACRPVTRVIVTERDRGVNVSYLHVQPLAEDGGAESAAPVCGGASWSVTPQGRGVRLTPSLTRDNAVLEAPRGTYVVTVSYPGPFHDVSGSKTVSFR
ncbi:MAG: hypothetical protein ABW221_01915 [Vicinamibacteria bacterium]